MEAAGRQRALLLPLVFFLFLSSCMGVPKLGVYRGPSPYGPNNLPAYEEWIGSPVIYGLDFEATDTWANIAGPSWITGGWGPWVSAAPPGQQRTWIVSVPMFISSIATLTGLQNGAAGQYNTHFNTLGQNLVSKNLSASVIRIGWEMNLPGSPWTLTANATLWAEFYRQIVNTLRSVPGQAFTFLWNPNNNFPAEDAYPGDGYVDIVGVDSYDACWLNNAPSYLTGVKQKGFWYASKNWTMGDGAEYKEHFYKALNNIMFGGASPDKDSSNWQLLITPDQYNTSRRNCINYFFHGYYGLDYWSGFARQHNKPLAIVEWGVWNQDSGHGGGDDPLFIEAMFDFVFNDTNNVLFFSYFDVHAGDGNHQLVPESGRYADFPTSRDTFLRLWKEKSEQGATTGGGPTSSSSASSLYPSFLLL